MMDNRTRRANCLPTTVPVVIGLAVACAVVGCGDGCSGRRMLLEQDFNQHDSCDTKWSLGDGQTEVVVGDLTGFESLMDDEDAVQGELESDEIVDAVAPVCVTDDDCDDGNLCTHDKCLEEGGQPICEHAVDAACCAKNCEWKECGSDGCGGSCGDCDGFGECQDGHCVTGCFPECQDKVCGMEPACSLSCGFCPEGSTCSPEGACDPCEPDCAGKECGSDGCQGVCYYQCNNGDCQFCPTDEPNCAGDQQCVHECAGCQLFSCPNTDFESGNLDFWNVRGDAGVLSGLGAAEPLTGEHMGYVATGMYSVNYTDLYPPHWENYNALSRRLCVDDSVKTVQLYWRLFSGEIGPDPPSEDPDKFLARLQVFHADGSYDLLNATGLGYAWKLGQKHGVEPAGVEFAGHPVWMTPWVMASFELEEAQYQEGDNVELLLQVVAIPDDEVETLVLVDALQLLGPTACESVGDCNAVNKCYEGACDDGECQFAWLEGCCNTASECSDFDACTNDDCVDHICVNTWVCCTEDADCADADPCTQDSCTAGQCLHEPVAGCCAIDGDCDDSDPCSVDTCVAGSCSSSLLDTCSYCGNGICAGEESPVCPADCTVPEPGCMPGQPKPGGGGYEILSPGCAGCACEQCVCAALPYCCDIAWEQQCAFLCKELCGGCGGPHGCGDGWCHTGAGSAGGENCLACPEDCGGCNDCGNGLCGLGEDCAACPEDCGPCPSAFCGDGSCQPFDEDCWTCPADCGTCSGCAASSAPACGGCECEATVCAQDPSCCDQFWGAHCKALCVSEGNCPNYCGDGVCSSGSGRDEGESWEICPDDCGWCGDGICAGGESVWNCPIDCNICGDGYCGGGETEWNCAEDCSPA